MAYDRKLTFWYVSPIDAHPTYTDRRPRHIGRMGGITSTMRLRPGACGNT